MYLINLKDIKMFRLAGRVTYIFVKLNYLLQNVIHSISAFKLGPFSRPLLDTSHQCALCGASRRWWKMTFVINALTINCQIIAEPACWPLPQLHFPLQCPHNSRSVRRSAAASDALGQSSLWQELKWVTLWPKALRANISHHPPQPHLSPCICS